MAGFMGGLMGAMTATMMLNDHLKLAGIVVFIVSSVILVGLNFMIYKETRETERKQKDGDFFTVLWSSMLTFLTIWLIVFGPRSGLFS